MSIPGIPGLDQFEPEEDHSQSQYAGQTKYVDLKKEQEWRFEVALGKGIEVKVRCANEHPSHT